MIENVEDIKREALATHLQAELDDVTLAQYDTDGTTFDAPGRTEWLVLDDSEADDKVAESIDDSLWAFRSEFLADYLNVPEVMISATQEAMSEDANDAFRTLIERSDNGMEGFVSEAVGADGRGIFLAGYDHEEVELHAEVTDDDGGTISLTFYAYRTN